MISVGTTSCRTLESAAGVHPELFSPTEADKGNSPLTGANSPILTQDTGIFIYPGYDFTVTDAPTPTSHLPERSPTMLASARLGREKTLHAYEVAVKERYRFFSFGDAMYISDIK